MRSVFRRLLLLFHVLRYGTRLIWLAAPQHHKLHWFATLASRMHESGSARASLHAALPNLGPLASAFTEALADHPELAAGTLHDAIDAVGHLGEPLTPHETGCALAAAFGAPLATVFSAVDLVPAQNGIAWQMHVARLATPVAGHSSVEIKLLRAAQVQQIGDEIALLRWIARCLETISATARRLRLRELAASFQHDLTRCFDLRAQAANLSQTGHHFADDTRLVVPEVVWDLCTPHTLAIQHIDTLPAGDPAALRVHGIQPARVAVHLVAIVARQVFEHGFFHTTLDAGRIRVSIEAATRGRLVLAGFAIMSTLSSQEREFFVHGAAALFAQDYARLADLHRDAGHVPPDARIERIEAELRTRSEAHFAASPEGRSAGALFHDLLHAVRPFEGHVAPGLAIAQRSFDQAERLAQALHPGIDTWTIAHGVLTGIARRDAGYEGWIKQISLELPHLAHLVPRVPQLLARYLQQRHDEAASGRQGHLTREAGQEYRRTRKLLWACVVCGVMLGVIAMLLSR